MQHHEVRIFSHVSVNEFFCASTAIDFSELFLLAITSVEVSVDVSGLEAVPAVTTKFERDIP